MSQVQLNVTITGGTGTVFIDINNVIYKFQGDGSHIRSIDLNPQHYVATISGSEPSDGSVDIKFQQGSAILGAATFSQTVFYGLLPILVS